MGGFSFRFFGDEIFYDGGLGVYELLEYLGRKMGLGIALHSRCLEGFSGAWDTKDWNTDSPLRHGMIGYQRSIYMAFLDSSFSSNISS